MYNGTVARWDLAGNFLGYVTLSGYANSVNVGFADGYPANRGLAAAGNSWLTLDAGGVLTAWDFAGNQVDHTTLLSAGGTFDSYFSLSYANGKVWVADQQEGLWRGYDVGLNQVAAPEPATLFLIGSGALGMAVRFRKRHV
jgi:hypothetical protein